MSKLLAIQTMFLLWLMCQCNSISAQANVMEYSSLSSLELVMSIAAVGLQVAHSRVVYVTPNATAPCPMSDNSSCHTLSWYSHSDRERLLSNDTVVKLLKGIHILNSTIQIKNRKNLTIKGPGEDGYTLSFTDDRGQTSHPVTWINCTSSAETGIVFLNSTDIQIVNLGFDSCGTNAGEFNVSAALFFGMSYNVSISQVIINNTYGSGLHMNCVFGNIWIKDSVLVRASKARDGSLGGNAKLWFGQSSRYTENQCYSSTKNANLRIFRSSFMQGLKGSIGVEIIIDCPQVYVLMSNVNAVNNTGGNIVLSLTTFDGHAPTSSMVHINHSIINGGSAHIGGGIRVWSRHHQGESMHIVNYNNSHMHSALLTVHNTSFTFNSAIERGGAVYILHHQSYCIGYFCQVENIKILFMNCSFVNNFGNGAAMETKQHLTSADYSLTVLSVSLNGCLFHRNFVQNNKSGPIINLIMTYMTISDSSFADNNGSALTLLKSSLNFHGDIRFANNHADYGAAMRVCEASLISLQFNNTHITFTNNTAFFKGGAVYTQHRSCVDTVSPCLFQPQLHENVSTKSLAKGLKLAIEFVNNSASIAGDAIYGGSLDHCFFIANSKLQSDKMLPMLNMSGQTGPSWVSSDPQGVCFCDDNEQLSRNYECRKEHPIIEVYPGERFNVSMITVGQMNGSTPGGIISTLNDSNDGSDRLIVHRVRTASSSKCENMTFILQSKRKLVNILFDIVPALTGPRTYVRSQSAQVTVSLKPCPIGFFKNENHSCKCNPAFYAVDRVCDIDKQEISMDYHIWIGCLKISSLQSCEFAFSHGCGYCTIDYTGPRTVSVFHLDDQCLPGRTGVLCGACKPGLNRMLEQFRVPADCMNCSNTNLAFLIPLVLFSGIILVIFHMTVTEGAINGLIFYSSVAYAQPRFFRTNQPAFIPWIFVSWLNLDLGFEICAYNGMTGYQYIWLSFGYIFCLIFTLIFIIYLSQKFISFTRLVRRNATSVLATIITLAYSRVIFVCYHSLKGQFMSVITNGSQIDKKCVWSFDGNIPYLGPKHIPLFIVAIICLLILLWFTFSLLMIQCLQKRSNIWCLRWVERLRPFFEAYTGPCNDNARFWPGFLLLLRLGLFNVEVYEYNVTLVAGICFLIIPLACIFPHGVYKKWPLNVLELLFVSNLGITFVVVQYAGHSRYYRIKTLTTGLATQLSTSFTLIMFFGILLYHIYRRIKGTPVWKKPTKLVSASVKKLQVVKRRWSHKDEESDDEKALLLPQPLPPVIKFPEYREPLLED